MKRFFLFIFALFVFYLWFKKCNDDNYQVDVEDYHLRARLIDNYFASHNLPLTGYGYKFVIEAEKNNLDWRLLPAIGMIESTGGKFIRAKTKNNPFGYGNYSFNCFAEAIEHVSRSLGGNDPKTAHYYVNKGIKGKLYSYNQEDPDYQRKIFLVMEKISSGV
jgi:hypothetical protein